MQASAGLPSSPPLFVGEMERDLALLCSGAVSLKALHQPSISLVSAPRLSAVVERSPPDKPNTFPIYLFAHFRCPSSFRYRTVSFRYRTEASFRYRTTYRSRVSSAFLDADGLPSGPRGPKGSQSKAGNLHSLACLVLRFPRLVQMMRSSISSARNARWAVAWPI